MSAPAGKGDEPLQLTPREIKVWDAIKEDLEARNALVFLAKKMEMTESELICHFVQEAFGPAVVLDVSWRKRLRDVARLQRLAKTLRRTSALLREANGLRLWSMTVPDAALPGVSVQLVPIMGQDMATGAIVRDPSYRDLKAAFEHLPKYLYLYAQNVELKLSRTRSFARTRPTSSQMERRFEDLMADFVARQSGRPYRDKIVAILRVTHPLANRKAPETGGTLRKRSQRNRTRSNERPDSN